MHEKLEKIKAHVGRHKVAYTAGTVVVIAGVSFYIGTRVGCSNTLSPSIFGINNKLNQQVITLVDRKGPPSWVIGKVGTDLEWNSMEATAIAEGLRLRELRAHLNGLLDNVNGARYFRKGLAAA